MNKRHTIFLPREENPTGFPAYLIVSGKTSYFSNDLKCDYTVGNDTFAKDE